MIVDVSKKILIVGLGLLGGSYAKVLKRFGFHISAITKEQSSIDYALKENLIDEIYQFIAPKIVNDNLAKSCFDGDSLEKIADCRELRIYDTQLIGDDVLIKTILRNTL